MNTSEYFVKGDKGVGEEEEAQRRIAALIGKVQRLESDNFELNKKVEKVINSIEDQKRRHLKEVCFSNYQLNVDISMFF